jgi:hypothetical protein
VPEAYIIGDEDWFGDKMAFKMKRERAEEAEIMRTPLLDCEKAHVDSFPRAIEAFTGGNAEYVQWCKEEAIQLSLERKRRRNAAAVSATQTSLTSGGALLN